MTTANLDTYSLIYEESKYLHECTYCGFEVNLYESEHECPICKEGKLCRAAHCTTWSSVSLPLEDGLEVSRE